MPLNRNIRNIVNGLFPVANLAPRPSQSQYAQMDAKAAQQRQQQQGQQAQNNSFGFPGGSFQGLPGADFFHGQPGGLLGIDRNNEDQNNLLQGLLQQLQGGTQNLNLPGNQSSFGPIAQNAERQFSQSTVPGLAERFFGQGSGAGVGSPDFTRALSGAGADLQSQLGALASQHGLQEQSLQSNNLMNLLQQYLQPRQDKLYTPAQEAGWSSALRGAGQTAAQAAPLFF